MQLLLAIPFLILTLSHALILFPVFERICRSPSVPFTFHICMSNWFGLFSVAWIHKSEHLQQFSCTSLFITMETFPLHSWETVIEKICSHIAYCWRASVIVAVGVPIAIPLTYKSKMLRHSKFMIYVYIIYTDENHTIVTSQQFFRPGAKWWVRYQFVWIWCVWANAKHVG